jgi:hypothetical protein
MAKLPKIVCNVQLSIDVVKGMEFYSECGLNEAMLCTSRPLPSTTRQLSSPKSIRDHGSQTS